MMFSALLILPLLSVVSAQFAPTLTVTCTVAPSYTFTVTGGSATGVIFIDGVCPAQSTGTAGPYTFNAATCASPGPIPALGTEFKVVVQENADINIAEDYIVKVTCNLDTSTVTEVVSVGTAGEDFDSTDTPTVSPTFTVAVTDSNGDPLVSGTVGDTVSVDFTIPAGEAAVFDYQITTMAVSADGYSTDVIASGCSEYSTVISNPGAASAGALSLSFDLFIPKDTSASAALPGTSAVTVTFTFTITVCDSSCAAVTCARKKRSVTPSTNSTLDSVKVSTSLIVWPAGSGHKSITSGSRHGDGEEEVNLCLSGTPLIGVLVALSVALVVCMALTSWMFCRLKRSGPKDSSSAASFANHSYKA